MNKFIISLIIIFYNIASLYSYKASKTDFYLLTGTAGGEEVIMHLYIERTNLSAICFNSDNDSYFDAYYYYVDSDGNSFVKGGGYENEENISVFSGYTKGGRIFMTNDNKDTISCNYMVGFSGNKFGVIEIESKYNSKKLNLYRADTPLSTLEILDYEFHNDSFDVSKREVLFRNENFDECIQKYNDLYNDSYEVIGWEQESESISYIDNKIIIIYAGSYMNYGITSGDSSYTAYSLDTLESIETSDFISDENLLKLLRTRNKDIDFGDWNYCTFDITYYGTIIFFGPSTEYGTEFEYIHEFSFDEIKPFIKKNSPLEYLFN